MATLRAALHAPATRGGVALTAQAHARKTSSKSPSKGSSKGSSKAALQRVGKRFLAFIVEQHPFALPAARAAWARSAPGIAARSAPGIAARSAPGIAARSAPGNGARSAPGIAARSAGGLDAAGGGDLAALGRRVNEALLDELGAARLPAADLGETTPFVPATVRLDEERARLALAVDGFFSREAERAALTPEEKQWMLRGIILTRAVDNRMKQLFLSSEMKYGELGFQGKGFRSLGQEAIYAAALRLRRGGAWGTGESSAGWRGDVVGPLIRDLGLTLAFTDDIEMALNAQVGKDGPPSDGKDLHLGCPARGVVMVAAPLSIATCTVTGYALAFQRRGEDRVAFSFIGEGGSSLGEWHEAINLAAAMKLPAVFCVQNNQTALSTPVREQSRVRTFADKALGYGIPHVSVDGTDPDSIAAPFAWAAARARAGEGPSLVETIAMRMCGHAHHDDMLYLGGDPPLGFELPPTPEKGYVDRAKYAAWAARDPLASYARKLLDEGVVDAPAIARWQEEAVARVEAAVERLRSRPWPDATKAGERLFSDGAAVVHPPAVALPPLPAGGAGGAGVAVERGVEAAPPFHPKGATFLEAIGRGLEDVLTAEPESFLLGEDVGPPYGNAFLLLKPLVERFGDRLLNTPIAEGGIIGACVGSALAGLRPIGEIQFNDFVASGFNQVVNNAAKLSYRAGTPVPMTLRMPWGGLRRAGPFHSQDTAPWFFRSFGLKIVVPSTPHDARALIASAVADDNPVLFYEHIALYRDPRIKQVLDDEPARIPLGQAAFRRLGNDLSLISYGAYVHKAMLVAEKLEREDGVSCDVLDLRSLSPLDWPRIEATVRRTGKVLFVGEDARTGSILESIASRVTESLFMELDGPVRVLGSLDVPVPYSPSLEDAYLLSEGQILETARALLAF
jgi:2-oxoisovalerate dehydrogenase E1 component